MYTKIVSTRILTKRVLEKAKLYGIKIMDKDFISIDFDIAEKNSSFLSFLNDRILVFTSINGIKGFIDLLSSHNMSTSSKSYSCYCIDGRTSNFAFKNNLNVIQTASTSMELAKKIVHENKHSKLLYFTCKMRTFLFEKCLKSYNIDIKIEIVYKKTLTPSFVNNFNGVMFFSASQVVSFCKSNLLDKEVPVFCIGPTTAKCLKKMGHENISIASKAKEDDLINCVIEYFQK
tara:strand:+ start:1935 stop:2630 length:696 start_codon:yes stop_codon:yes gene_type:complete